MEQILREAYRSGKSDEYVAQVLCDNAQEYFNNEVVRPDDMTDEEFDELYDKVTEAYIEGHYENYDEDTIISTLTI